MIPSNGIENFYLFFLLSHQYYFGGFYLMYLITLNDHLLGPGMLTNQDNLSIMLFKFDLLPGHPHWSGWSCGGWQPFASSGRPPRGGAGVAPLFFFFFFKILILLIHKFF